jgi:hypothetical protein
LAGKLQPRSRGNEQVGINLSYVKRLRSVLLFACYCSFPMARLTAQIVPVGACRQASLPAQSEQVVAHTRLGTQQVSGWFARFLCEDKSVRWR